MEKKTNSSFFRLDTSCWHIIRLIFLIAGLILLASVALALILGITWLILTAFVSTVMIIFAMTGLCPMAYFLSKLGKPFSCEK